MEFPQKVRLSDGDDKIDRIMRGFRFENVGLAQPSPVIAALKLDHHVPVVANYKMSLAGVDIAFAAIILPDDPRQKLELVTLLNTPGEEPRLFKIRVEDLLKEVDPMTYPMAGVQTKTDPPDVLRNMPLTSSPKLRHFNA